MSYISDTYDFLLARAAAALPNHRKMRSPYFPEIEDDLTLEKCWGLTVLDGSLSSVGSYVIDVTQQFEFLIIRTYRGFKESVTIRETAEKNIFEDRLLLAKGIYQNWLNGQLNPFIKDLVISNDAGLEFVRGDRADILALRTIVDVKFHEETN